MHQLISQAWRAFTSLLYKRTILILTLLLFAGITASLWNISRFSTNLIQSQAFQNAALYARAINTARTLYSDAVVDRLKAIAGTQGIIAVAKAIRTHVPKLIVNSSF